MPGHDDDDPYIGTVVTIISLAAGLPSVKAVYDQRRYFDAAMGILLFFSSVLYHLSDTWNTNALFLSELQWHKLDNIGVLNVFATTLINLSDFEKESTSETWRWVSLFFVLIVQEKDPWDLKWTVVPLIAFFLMPIIKFSWNYVVHGASLKPNYVWKHFWLGSVFLIGLGLPCFVLGLDDDKDPYRIFHFLWHFFGAVSAYYLNTSVKRTLMRNKQLAREIIKDDKEFRERSVSLMEQ